MYDYIQNKLKGSVSLKRKMKRLTGLLLAVMMVLGTFTATAASLDLEATGAGTHTVYYCYKGTVPDGYTVKANCNIGDNNTWKIFDMTDTGSTYQGYKIYSGTVEEKYGGFDALQFQQYDASGTWVSQEVAISGWTKSSTFSGRMYYNGSWMDYTTDNPDVTETTSPSSEVTTTIYLNTSAVSGWGSNAYYDVAKTTNAWSGNRFHPNSGNNLSSYGSMTKVSDNLFMAEITYDPSVGMIAFSNANMHNYGDYNGNSAVVVKDYTGTVGVNNLVTLKSSTVSTTNTNYYAYELGTYGSQETTTSQPNTQTSTQLDTNPTQTTTTTGGSVITDTVKATAFSNAMWVDTQPETANTKVALVKAYEGSSGYRLYLPSGVDRSNLTIYHSFTSLSINGTTITSGNTYDMTNWSDTSCSVNGTDKSFKIFQSTAKSFYMYTYSTAEDGTKSDKNLPTTTDSSLTSKSSVSKKGSYLVVDNNGVVTQAEDTLSSVKGRGNSSWEASYKEFGKYAYNIKINTAIKLGGSSSTKSKKWCLLANNADEAMMRNTVVYNLADSIGLEDSPMSDIYDVYNNGNYLGTYQIAEKVEVSSSKALVEGENVDDMNEDANPTYDFDNPQRASSNGKINETSAAGYYKYCTGLTTPANYKDGDYLLEFELNERFADEISGFISNRGQQVVLKTPEVATKEEVIYIMDKFNAAEAVAYAQAGSSTTDFAAGSLSTSNGKYTYTSSVSDYSVTVSSYDELIDAESFAQNYLVQEYVENLDGVATSFYVNLKNQDSLFTATPVWDFDWTMGQYGNSKKISSSKTLYPNNTDQWFIRYKAIYNNYDVDNLVTKLCKIDDFWSRVKIQWKYNVYPEIQKLYGSSGLIKNDYTNKLSASVAMNEDRYHFIANDPIGGWGSANTGSTWSEAVNFLNNWASSRASWINNNIGTAVSYNKSGTSTGLSVSQADDNSIVAEATPGTITADSTTLGNSDFTYEFTYTNGTDTKTITKVGSNTATLTDTATAGDVYTVSVNAYPTKAGKDTGFVLSSDEVSYTVVNSSDPTLTVSPTTLSLTVGDTSTLKVKKTNIDEDVTWSTDNESVATVDNGVVTAVAEGTATITATAGGLSATCVVTVSEPVSSVITLYFTDNKSWGSVKAWIWNNTTKTNESASWPGKSCTKIGKNSQNQDVYSCTMDTSLYDSVIFASSDGKSQTKEIYNITSANDGTGYYITGGSSSAYEVATYSVVTPAVKLSTSAVELMVGGEYTITPASSKGTLSYESSNTAVATVDENGVVKAVAKGNATITVTATGTFETATATLDVTVNDKYTVTFKNYDGTVISTEKYDAGEAVVVPTETPVKPADKQYTYTFSGWDKDIVETVNEDATYTAVFTGTLNKYSVSVSTVNGTVTGCPTDAVDYGTSVTLKAKANEGYTFAGYYVGDTRVSSSSTYTFTVEGNTEVVARFTQLPGAELKVQVVGGTGLKVKLGANGVETTQSIFYCNKDVKTGQYVTLTPTGIDGYDFLYWISDNGKIVSYSQSYTFMFTEKTSLTAVYSQASAGVVTFMSGYNQINSSMCYGSADEIKLPTPYAKSGYTFKFWSINGTTECTVSDIYTASQSGNVTVKAVYEAEDIYFSLTINGGTIVSVDNNTADAGNTTGSYKTINAIKVQPKVAEAGKKFAYWEDQDGNILSYSSEHLLYLNSDTTITAVFVDENEVVDAKAIAEISSISLNETTNKMSVMAVLTVPSDCTIISGGLLATNNEMIGASADSFTYDNATYKKVENVESYGYQILQYAWTKSNVFYGDIWFLRAYVTYKDANGNTYEVYGDVVTNESLFA